jgi:predicted metal-dependent HD superfamily phosphohydrolase
MEGDSRENHAGEAGGGNAISISSIRANGCFDHTRGPLGFARGSLREAWDSTVLDLAAEARGSAGVGGDDDGDPAEAQRRRQQQQALAGQWFDRLWAAQADDPARHYHTIVHVWEMILYLNLLVEGKDAAAARLDLSSIQKPVIFLAILFHDAVYDPKSSTNEEDSARLFHAFANDTGLARARPDACQQVTTYILTTKKHEALDTNSPGLALFLDIDMAVLGKGPEAYREYAALIRREYAHVPALIYRAKRAQVLEAFLRQPRIFGTPAVRDLLEGQARDNLRAEIAALRGGVIYGEEPRSYCTLL